MKKEMLSLVFLLSLFLVSFATAEQYTSTTAVAFNAGDVSQAVKTSSDDSGMWKDVAASVALILIIIAACMIYRKRKAKAKKARVVAKKKIAKKVVRKKSRRK